MTKFNVGDKVRIVTVDRYAMSGFGVGDICEVTDHSNVKRNRYEVRKGDLYGYTGAEHLTLYTDTNARLTEAEAKIAALEAEVKALKDAESWKRIGMTYGEITAMLGRTTKTDLRTPNQRRADVIKRAQAFIMTTLNDYQISDDEVVYTVNTGKRVVEVSLKHIFSGKVLIKRTAKCTPDDVFNADIGKAIALGRALGVKVPMEFTDAVKPTEYAVGQKVEYSAVYEPVVHKIVRIEGERAYIQSGGFHNTKRAKEAGYRILDDSDAVYL